MVRDAGAAAGAGHLRGEPHHAGIEFDRGAIGDRWHIADVVLEVAQPRQPCYKLGIRMGDDSFVARFATAGRPGVYLRVVEAGTVHADDPIHVEPAAPPHIPVTALARPDPTRPDPPHPHPRRR